MDLIRDFRKVSQSLRADQKLGISRAWTLFLMRGGLHGSPNQIRRNARNVLKQLFPKSTQAEIDRLVFYFLIRMSSAIGDQMAHTGMKERTFEEATASRDKLADAKSSISEMSNSDLYQLQMMMNKKQSLESMISTLMKAASDSQAEIAGNLKGA